MEERPIVLVLDEGDRYTEDKAANLAVRWNEQTGVWELIEYRGYRVGGKCPGCDTIMMAHCTPEHAIAGVCSGNWTCPWCEGCGPVKEEDFDFDETNLSGVGTCKKCSEEWLNSEEGQKDQKYWESLKEESSNQ